MKLNEAYEHRSELCDGTNLKAIELTSGMNGYPKNVRPAVIGFETFDEALKAAENTDGCVSAFYQKYGWQLWEEDGTKNEPFDLLEEYSKQNGTVLYQLLYPVKLMALLPVCLQQQGVKKLLISLTTTINHTL